MYSLVDLVLAMLTTPIVHGHMSVLTPSLYIFAGLRRLVRAVLIFGPVLPHGKQDVKAHTPTSDVNYFKTLR